MEARQGYIAGMDQDTAVNKRNPASYLLATNFRILTTDGVSTGSLETEKGHTLSFKLPELPAQTLSDGTVIPAQSNLKFVGSTSMVNKLILFSTSDTSINPNSYGQIWVCEFDESTNSIQGLIGDSLSPSVHLKYNNKVNFSTEYRIKAVARYESSKIQRVYWTDFYNSVRVLNIADPNSLNVAVSSLDLKPGVSFTQPNILRVGTGNLPTGCVAQFAYRLLDTSGAESLVSPVSSITPLILESLETTNYVDFSGNGNSSAKNKSVTYEIKGIDTNYDVIEHLAIITDQSQTVTIYKFREDKVPESGNMEVTCDDIDEATTIGLVEFNMLSSGFDKAKDIEVHNRRLIAANTITADFDIDYDARAYRFNSSLNCLLKGAPDINLAGGINPNYSSIPETHDAINIYNDESHPTWFNPESQYKYQKDGSTLGGSGKNISYRFITELLPSDYSTGITTAPPHIVMTNHNNSDSPLDLNVLNPDGSLRLTPKGTQFKNYASGWAHGHLAGYSRGETYRFGIVFHSKKGSTSFVKWIGDIRFPDVEDGYPLQVNIGNTHYLSILGIQFNIDVSELQEDIMGYSIVRVKREDQDCTKLGSGMLMFFDKQDNTYRHSLMHRWESSGPNGSPDTSNHPWQIEADTNINGSIIGSILHLSDKPGFNAIQTVDASTKKICYLISPLGQLYNTSFKNNDFISTRGYYSAELALYGGDYDNSNEVDRDYAFYYKLKDYYANPYKRERFEIGRSYAATIGQYFSATGGFLSGYTGGNNLMNASYTRDKVGGVETGNSNVPLGMGSPKLILLLGNGNNLIHSTGDPGNAVGNLSTANMRWYDSQWIAPGFSGTAIDFNGGNAATTTTYFKEVVYSRYLEEQYGGNTFTQRSLNRYISCGHFQNISSGVITSPKIFGGDTFVSYYDDEQIQQYWGSENYLDTYKDASTNKLSVAVCLPVESRVNPHLRAGSHWAAFRNGNNMGAYESNSFSYPNVWTTENTVEEKFYAKDFLLNLTEEHPHQMWASENKVDGELIDNWRIFKAANSTEIDGIHGPINRLISFNQHLLAYQDKAFGIASIDEKVTIPDSTGQNLVLGKGGVFPVFTYISTSTGSSHQYGVIPAPSGVYHYDSRLKKIFKYSGGAESLSDMKGLSSFLQNELKGEIGVIDKTLRHNSPMGVHGTVDNRYNGVLFTFLGNKPASTLNEFLNTSTNEYIFPDNTYVTQGEFTYYIPNELIIPNDGHIDLSIYREDVFRYSNSFTLSYNEMTGAFEALHDYVPGMYLEYGRRLLSASPLIKQEMYTHNTGVTGSFYGRVPVKSKLKTLLAHGGDTTKIFNNLEYQSQLTNSNGEDIYDETLNRILIKNDYQTTGMHELVVDENIKRRMRTWRYIIPRDKNAELSRIRNPWVEVEIQFDNNNDKRLVLHELQYSYTPSRM